MNRWSATVLCCCAAVEAVAQQPQPEAPAFRADTRLVEIDVVVRDRAGPVRGLTRDDFTVFDRGKPQPISVFREAVGAKREPTAPLPPGAISNRVDARGRPVSNATVLLLDYLNTVVDNSDYARSWAMKFLETPRDDERIAVYLLGKKLGVVQDLTDDPGKLAQAVKKWDPKLGILGVHWMDNADATDLQMEGMSAAAYIELRSRMTVEAIRRIAEHLSGVPGRRSLVWLAETPQFDAKVMSALRAANVALYPVLVRGAPGYVDHRLFGAPRDPILVTAERDRRLQALAASTGGAAFTDSRDVSIAMRRAEEDAASEYVLGYYPAGESLDGRFHPLKVDVARKGAAREARSPEVRYRNGYIASAASAAPVAGSNLRDLLSNPLDSTGIGMTAAASRDPQRPGTYHVDLLVDLHDVRMEQEGSMRTGAIELNLIDPVSRFVRSSAIPIQIPADQFADLLEHGFVIRLDGLEFPGTEMMIAIRDKASGLAGSLRVELKR